MKKIHVVLIAIILITQHQKLSAQNAPTWADVVGAVTTSNKITKTASDGWGTGGAASAEVLDFATNGSIKITISETNKAKAFGLSTQNMDAGLISIEYAIYVATDGRIYAYEKGANRSNPGITCLIGDVLSVERFENEISYKRNDITFYKSAIQSTSKLFADIALNHTGAELDQVTLSNTFTSPQASNTNPNAAGVNQTVTWTDMNNVAFIDSKIVKTSASGFGTGGAASSERLDFITDGWVEATAFETNTAKAFGLSQQNLDAGLTSIDYAIYMNNDGRIYAYEKGTNRSNPGITYIKGDVLRVERLGTQILYKHNGTTFYTSALQSNSRLIADLALNQTGATLDQITISSSFNLPQASNTDPNATGVSQTLAWTDVDNLAFIDSKIVKTSASGFGTGGAASSERLDFITDGWVEVTAFETNTAKAFGLSKENPDAGFTSIGHAIYMANDRRIYAYEKGTSRSNPGITYNKGDVLRVERLGTQILYKHNGSTFYTSALQSTSRLIADVSLNHTGATLDQIALSGSFAQPQATNTDPNAAGVSQTVTWTDVDNLAFIGSKLVKTSASGFGTGGAASVETLDLVTNGSVQAKIFETNTAKAFGLSKQNNDAGLTSIDYAIYIGTDKRIYAYEKGTNRSNPGITCNTGDVLKVERVGPLIKYKHNDVTFYTSAVYSTSKLVADIAINTQGGTLDQISVSNSFEAPQTSNTDPNAASQTVNWTDLDNLAFIGTKLIKTSPSGWGTGGAASSDEIAENTEGWVESIVFETNSSRMFGLSEQNAGADYTTIDHAIYLASDNKVYIYENGAQVLNTGITYISGDAFKIQRSGTQIIYKRNEINLFTSTVQSTSKLIVDLAIHSLEGTLDQITLSNSATQNPTPTPNGTGGLWSQNVNNAGDIFHQGNVAIGRDNIIDGHILTVEGKILTQGVKVTLNGWADYVFAQGYDLKSLKSLEEFIKQNKHLPDVPSEAQVLEEGIYLGEMNKILLQKIEELTLYLLQQNRSIVELEKKIESQKEKKTVDRKH